MPARVRKGWVVAFSREEGERERRWEVSEEGGIVILERLDGFVEFFATSCP